MYLNIGAVAILAIVVIIISVISNMNLQSNPSIGTSNINANANANVTTYDVTSEILNRSLMYGQVIIALGAFILLLVLVLGFLAYKTK